MATVERYSSFEEMEKAEKISRKKSSIKTSANQKLFKQVGVLLRKGIVSKPLKKK